MRPLTFLETHELIDMMEWVADKKKKWHHEQINILQENGEGVLGYIVTPVKCDKCNATHNVIHPVGLRYPLECCECKEMACWMYEYPNKPLP